MTEEDSSLTMIDFLKDSYKELQCYDTISERNKQQFQHFKKNIQSLISTSLVTSVDQDLFNKYMILKKENASVQLMVQKQQKEVSSLEKTDIKREKLITNLEQKLKDLTKNYEKLKTEKEQEEQEDRASIRIFQKALKLYVTCLQYKIEEAGLVENDKYSVVITFIFNGEPSKYPITFIFDAQINCLISFDAGSLLTKQQQDILHQRFTETGNYLALFTTLRHGALRKKLCESNKQ